MLKSIMFFIMGGLFALFITNTPLKKAEVEIKGKIINPIQKYFNS